MVTRALALLKPALKSFDCHLLPHYNFRSTAKLHASAQQTNNCAAKCARAWHVSWRLALHEKSPLLPASAWFRRWATIGTRGAMVCAQALPPTRAITQFEAVDPQGEPLPCRVAGEIRDFEPARWMEAKDLTRVPRAVPMAIAAAHGALCSSGIEFENLSVAAQRDISVVIGSGGGGFSFAEAQFALWYRGQK